MTLLLDSRNRRNEYSGADDGGREARKEAVRAGRLGGGGGGASGGGSSGGGGSGAAEDAEEKN